MKFNCLSPEEFIKLSTSITLFLTQKFDFEDLEIIKNLLCSVNNNLSSYIGQKNCYEKHKKN